MIVARDRRGFTLVELLIALSIVGALLAIAFGGLNVAIKAWRQGEDRAEAHQRDAAHALMGLGAILALPPGLDGHVEPAEGDGQQRADDWTARRQLDQREAATVARGDHQHTASFSSASDTVRKVVRPTTIAPTGRLHVDLVHVSGSPAGDVKSWGQRKLLDRAGPTCRLPSVPF